MEHHDDDRETRAALMLNALGNETRLRVYRTLVRAGSPGLSVGELQRRVGVPASTFAHHLSTLRQAGLVHQRRAGREVATAADFAAMDRLIEYLTEECCADVACQGTTGSTDGDGSRES
ncbi:MAG: metalloregulator ArsR/SmtB family transcription factor [Rhizobiales bacterium]|nr:metalloregulator ArsR/SmtB family transcription factor [Hyphomicrobiales bacterium]